MQTTEIIREAVAAASSIGLENQIRHLGAEEKKLSDPHYRVAFVGQFKTGKSTLINRLILKENVLFTDVLEATAIPVEVEYGDRKRLETFRFDKTSVLLPDNAGRMEYISGVSRDAVLENPNAEGIKAHTSGNSPEERAALASTYSHARLSWPAETLRRFTVVDTPGVNTTNEAVATATYRFLPECDLAIYVALPKQLGNVDTDFLRSKVFESGITRAMIVLNYDPRFNDGTPEQLEQIRRAVEAQLGQIGRGDIPVVLAEVPRITSSDYLSKATVRDSVDDWPGAPSSSPAPAAPAVATTILEKELARYIHDNILPAREEKIKNRLRRILETALAEARLELGLRLQSEQERASTIAQIDKTQRETDRNNDDIMHQFLAEFQPIQIKHRRKLLEGLNRIKLKFDNTLDQCGDLPAVQKHLLTSKPLLQLEVESLVLDSRQAILEDIKRMESKYSLALAESSAHWRDLDASLKIDGGMLEKTPPMIVYVADLLIACMVSPFPGVIDIIFRLLLNGIPQLSQFLPAGLAAKALKKFVSNSVETQFQLCERELSTNLDQSYDEAKRQIEENWKQQAKERRESLEAAKQRALGAADNTRTEALQSASAKFKTLLEQLPA